MFDMGFVCIDMDECFESIVVYECGLVMVLLGCIGGFSVDVWVY